MAAGWLSDQSIAQTFSGGMPDLYLWPMRLFSCLAALLLFFQSCTRPVKELQPLIQGADSVAVNIFTGDGRMDSVRRVHIIRDAAGISKLAGMITAAHAGYQPHCGSDGSLHFFRNNQVVKDIYFRVGTAPCRQFSFQLEGHWTASELNEEAAKLISSW